MGIFAQNTSNMLHTRPILTLSLSVLLIISSVLSADAAEPSRPRKEAPRSEFFSYDIREDAAAGTIINSQYFKSIRTRTDENGVCAVKFYAPFAFGDRNVFFRSEGGTGAYRLWVNGREVGGSDDTQTPSEVFISPYLIDGMNDIRIEAREPGSVAAVEAAYDEPMLPAGGNSHIFSQPKVYIEDYDVRTSPDSTTQHGLLDLHIAVRNSARTVQLLSVGYDIYGPKGKLKTYNLKEVIMLPGQRDTVRFHDIVYSTAKYLWDSNKPNLYAVTMYIKQHGKIVEYVPLDLGWGTTTYTPATADTPGTLLRNDAPVEIRAVEFTPKYNISVEEQVRALKRKGYNTLVLTMPAQIALYRACDRVGMYVIDCASVSTDPRGGNRSRNGGTTLNDPSYRDEILHRVEAMQRRTRNHSCVVAWSPAEGGGNGYNMYKAYELLHRLDTLRPVVYREADGEWNSDLIINPIATLE